MRTEKRFAGASVVIPESALDQALLVEILKADFVDQGTELMWLSIKLQYIDGGAFEVKSPLPNPSYPKHIGVVQSDSGEIEVYGV